MNPSKVKTLILEWYEVIALPLVLAAALMSDIHHVRPAGHVPEPEKTQPVIVNSGVVVGPVVANGPVVINVTNGPVVAKVTNEPVFDNGPVIGPPRRKPKAPKPDVRECACEVRRNLC